MNPAPDFKPFKKKHFDWAATCPDPERCAKMVTLGDSRWIFVMRPLTGERYDLLIQSSFPGLEGEGISYSKESDTLEGAHMAFNFAIHSVLVELVKAGVKAGITEDESAFVSDAMEHPEGELFPR